MYYKRKNGQNYLQNKIYVEKKTNPQTVKQFSALTVYKYNHKLPDRVLGTDWDLSYTGVTLLKLVDLQMSGSVSVQKTSLYERRHFYSVVLAFRNYNTFFSYVLGC